MIESINKSRGKPLLLSVLAWLLFLAMYLLIGAFTTLGMLIETSFLVASPAGMPGFGFWVASFTISIIWLLKAKNMAVSVSGLILSFIPLVFLVFVFWVDAEGGV